MQQKSRDNRESRKHMKSNTTLLKNTSQVLKTYFSLYKNRKNKTSFGENGLEENLGGGGEKTKLKKTKLRIHMKKNILSFNKCKLDTM